MTVTITASSAPVASNGTLTIAEDASARETLQATDPDGQALVFSLVTAPTKGTVTITASSGRYRYVPQPNANGADSFTFKASDGATDSNIASVAITITPVNDPPVAVGTSLTTRMNQSAGGTLQATDVDNTPLTFALAKAPRRGTAVVTPGGTFTYTPDSGFTGKDSFMFRVTDPAGVSATATVSVTVTP
jgi:VCBS repeat-containing protein